MMRKYFGIHMLSHTSPNDVAWIFLKQRKGQMKTYADMILPEDREAVENYIASMSPEKQQALTKIGEYVNTLPIEMRSKLTASMHNAYIQNAGKYSELLPPLHESNDSNEINKILPLVAVGVGLVFAADAVNTSQGADESFVGNVFTGVGNLVTPGQPFGETNFGGVVEYNSPKGYVDPITGTRHFENEDAGVLESVGMGLVSGAASFINPFSAVRGARAAGKVRTAGKVGPKSRAGRIADDAKASRLAARQSDDVLDDIAQLRGGYGKVSLDDLREVGVKGRFGRNIRSSRATRQAENIKDQIAANPQAFKNAQKYIDETGGMGFRGKINRLAGKTYSPTRMGRFGNFLGRNAYRMIQGNERMNNPINPFSYIFGQGPGDVPTDGGNIDTSGISGGSSFSNTNAFAGGAAGGTAGGFGEGYGMGNVSNIDSNMSQRREVWNPYADYSTTRGQTLAQRGMGDPGSFGGFGKGDTMKIGERMLKDATELMYNKHTVSKDDECCPDCGEKVGKMGCMKMGCGGMNKADKKPAGGMVIVIGSKAGPGPSKDGKREKLDSEKDKKE